VDHVIARRLLLAPLVALCALGATGCGSSQAPSNDVWMGVVASDAALLGSSVQWKQETELMHSSGAGSVRIPVYWNAVQPTASPVTPARLAHLDSVIASATKAGLTILPVVLGTPRWAAKYPKVKHKDGYSIPRDPAQYGAFLTVLVKRYGPDGTFWKDHSDLKKRPIRTWQIWNEPSLTYYWNQNADGTSRDKPFAASYVALLRAANAALKQADPGSKTMLAGFPNRSWVALAAVYRAKGRPYFDIAASHAYTALVKNVVRIVSIDRQTMAKYGDASKPIALTEISYSSGGPKVTGQPGWNTTEAGQAVRLTQVYLALARQRKAMNIIGAYWYSWLTPENTDASNWTDYSGLRKRDGFAIVSKPALAAYAAVAKKLR
jgi:hypothetical protein